MKTTIFALIVLIAGSLSLQAQDGRPDNRRGLHERADADGDGSITLEEFTQAQNEGARKRFERLDADSNDLISEDELEAGRARRMADRKRRGGDRPENGPGKSPREAPPSFEDLNTDGEEGLSLDEFLAMHQDRVASRFERMDQNGDGVLTKDETNRRRGQPRGKRGDRPERGRRGPAGED